MRNFLEQAKVHKAFFKMYFEIAGVFFHPIFLLFFKGIFHVCMCNTDGPFLLWAVLIFHGCFLKSTV